MIWDSKEYWLNNHVCFYRVRFESFGFSLTITPHVFDIMIGWFGFCIERY